MRKKSYKVAIEWDRSTREKKTTIDGGLRVTRCQLRRVARRISPTDGAELDRRRVPWRVLREIPQGPDPLVWRARLDAALARYPAPA